LQLEAGETQEISRLAETDLVGEIGLKGRGVRIALWPFMLHLDNGALGERLEEPEVQGIKKHGLVSSGLFDESHLTLLHAIDHLLGVCRKISLGDRGSCHDGYPTQVRVYINEEPEVVPGLACRLFEN